MIRLQHTWPPTDAERECLVASLAACTAEYFGTPASEGSLAEWRSMNVMELRRIRGQWFGLVNQYRRDVCAVPYK